MTSQDHKTKDFLQKIDFLINKGIVKNHAEVVKLLNWNKSVMSSVKNGDLVVPQHIYNKFKETFSDELKEETPDRKDEGYKDKYIELLEKQNESLQQNVQALQASLGLLRGELETVYSNQIMILSAQRSFQEFWAKHFSPPGKTANIVINELDNRAAELAESFSSTDNSSLLKGR